MHILIVGDRGVGKSTLIRRVLEALDPPLAGFETKKEDALEDPLRGCPVYIYEAGSIHRQGAENLIGYTKEKDDPRITAAFDRYAPRLQQPPHWGWVVKMDEIGFLEARSELFCRSILKLLDGDAPVIAAVKNLDLPFLQAVRSHPKARCFRITEENRDRLYPEVLEFLKKQLEESPGPGIR